MSSGSLPFVVGVCGHRDLCIAELPRLREEIAAFLGQLRQLLPATELRVMVGMANGADLVVARSALDLGLHVDAVLPMPLEQYAADFDAPALQALTELLQRPRVRREELPLPAAADRTAAYENLSAHLVRCSGLLLALWDGDTVALPGGTADTVMRFLGMHTEADARQTAPAFTDAGADPDAARLVYWIRANRDGQIAPATQPGFLSARGEYLLQRHGALPAQLRHQLAELDDYNRECGRLRDEELGESLLATMPDAAIEDRATLARIDAQYVMADALAVHFQTRSDGLFLCFSVMTLVMGCAYLAYERLTQDRVLLFVYLAMFFASFAIFFLVRGRHWFSRHLVYRALAETLRTMFYLRAAGAAHLVNTDEVLALSGIDRFHGFSWIGLALRGLDSGQAAPGTALPHAERAAAIERTWIDGQRCYFAARVARLERGSRRIAWLRNALFALIALVVLALILLEQPLHHRLLFGVQLGNLLTFSLGVTVVLLGVWELHQNKMATRELLWQYRNQLDHFARAKEQLTLAVTAAHRMRVLAELGKDSLMESYLWTIHRYHREHEPPGTA